MRKLGRLLIAFVISAVLGYTLAAIAATQFVLAQIIALGLPVPLGVRLRTTGQDLLGMAPMYLPVLAVGFLTAFLVAGLLNRWLGGQRTVWYTAAGAAAVVTVNLALHATFDITPIAGARGAWGLAAQAVAGATAGYTYAVLSRPGPA